MKVIAKRLLGVLFGLLLCAVAVIRYDGPVTCDGVSMGENDTCITIGHDEEARSYEEQAAMQKRWSIIVGTIGGLIAIGFCVATVNAAREQRRRTKVLRS